MPKIGAKPTAKTPMKTAPPKRPYRMVPFPKEQELLNLEIADLRNLQCCTCDHDRCCHDDFIGLGAGQHLILDCPSAGRCCVKGCNCDGFVFSERSSPEGKKRREREKKLSKVYPPQEK